MRIAVFTNNFPVLSETFVINQIVGLIDIGVEVDVIANERQQYDLMHSTVDKYSLLERLYCVGLSTHESKNRRVGKTILNLIKLVLKGKVTSISSVLFDKHLKIKQKMNLISALNTIKPNVLQYDNIICHFGTNGYYVCKMRELGLISGAISTVFHGYEVSHDRVVTAYLEQYKQLFKKGDLMLPISDLWGRKLIDWGCDHSKVKVHRMGIDVDDFELRDISSSFSSPLKLIQVGRLTEKKAILDSINAVALAAEKVAVDFTVIGEGELYDKAKTLIESLGAESYIHLLGKQPQNVVKKNLDEADVFILPSVRSKSGDMEGIPVALMEAMAKGLIVLSTNHSGIPELIKNETSGFLVDESSVDELSNTILKISRLNEEQLIKIRCKARSEVTKKYNSKDLNRKLSSYF